MLHGSTCYVFFGKAAAGWSLNIQVQGKGVMLDNFWKQKLMYIISTDWCEHCDWLSHYLTLYYLNLSPAYVGEI